MKASWFIQGHSYHYRCCISGVLESRSWIQLSDSQCEWY